MQSKNIIKKINDYEEFDMVLKGSYSADSVPLANIKPCSFYNHKKFCVEVWHDAIF